MHERGRYHILRVVGHVAAVRDRLLHQRGEVTVDYADVQIEIALLASVERQAERTAAALKQVRDLLREVAEMARQQQSYNSKKKEQA